MYCCLQLLLLYTISVAAQSRPRKQEAAPDTYISRTFSASTSAPFAAEFNEDENGRQALATMLTLLETEHQKHDRRLANWVYGRPDSGEYPCNEYLAKRFEEGLNNSLASRGFGEAIEPCTVELKLRFNVSMERAMLAYFQAVDNAKEGVLERIREFLQKTSRVWQQAHLFSRFRYHDNFQNCTLYHLTAFYVRGRWAVSADFTNAPPTVELEERTRWYLAESIFLDRNNRAKALRMSANGYPLVNGTVNTTTTSFAIWGGWPAPSRFTDRMTPENNPAVQAAIARMMAERQQAEDTSTKSNIAILLFPLVSALIPVASFADVSRLVAFAYLIITDVGAILPLAIKGLELLWFSRRNQDATILRIYGAEPKEKNGAAELWHAKCKTLEHLKLQGAVFLGVALSFMVTGILLELIMWKRLKRKKRAAAEKMGKYEREDLQQWERLGLEFSRGRCECCLLSSGKPSNVQLIY